MLLEEFVGSELRGLASMVVWIMLQEIICKPGVGRTGGWTDGWMRARPIIHEWMAEFQRLKFMHSFPSSWCWTIS